MYYEILPSVNSLILKDSDQKRYLLDQDRFKVYDITPVGSPIKVLSTTSKLEETLSKHYPGYNCNGINANAFYNMSRDCVADSFDNPSLKEAVQQCMREFLIVQFYYVPEERLFAYNDINAVMNRGNERPALIPVSEHKKIN